MRRERSTAWKQYSNNVNQQNMGRWAISVATTMFTPDIDSSNVFWDDDTFANTYEQPSNLAIYEAILISHYIKQFNL